MSFVHSIFFPLANLILLLGVVGYAWAHGGWEERACGAALLLDSVATGVVVRYFQLSHVANSWMRAAPLIMAIDSVLLIVLAAIALLSTRFWPLWVAGLQAPVVATHVAYMIDVHVLPYGYALAQAVWIYPMYVLLVVGARRRTQWRRIRQV